MKNIQYILFFLVIMLNGCDDANSAVYSPLFKDSYIGVELEIEKINNVKSDELFLLYKKTDRLSKNIEYKLLKIALDGKFDSLQLDYLTNSKNIKVGNISFTSNGRPVLSLINDGKVNLLLFNDKFKSFDVREIPSGEKVNSVYYFNEKTYLFTHVGSSIELNVYAYSVEKPVTLIKKQTLTLNSALSVKDGLFMKDETLLLLVEGVTTKGNSVRLATINNQINDVLYLDLNTAYENVNILESNKKGNFISLFLQQRDKGRVKNYSSLMFDVKKQKIVKDISENGNYKWVDILSIEGDAFISLEVEKNRVTKKYSVFCNNLSTSNRIKFGLEELGVDVLRRFYNKAFLLNKTEKGYLVAFVYSELRSRTTYDVFAIVEIENSICQ